MPNKQNDPPGSVAFCVPAYTMFQCCPLLHQFFRGGRRPNDDPIMFPCEALGNAAHFFKLLFCPPVRRVPCGHGHPVMCCPQSRRPEDNVLSYILAQIMHCADIVPVRICLLILPTQIPCCFQNLSPYFLNFGKGFYARDANKRECLSHFLRGKFLFAGCKSLPLFQLPPGFLNPPQLFLCDAKHFGWLAKLMETTQAAVAMWETGARMPRADKLPKLAEVLGCSVADLFAKPETA